MTKDATKTPDQKVAELEAQKAKYQEKIDTYKDKISELDRQIFKERKEAELGKLMQALVDSGKTMDEVLAALNK